MQGQIHNLSDAQYRLLGGVVATIFETIDEEKLRLLKAAVLNVANSDYMSAFEAQMLSRILRDISAAEVRFLAKYQERPWISFADPNQHGVGPFYTVESPQPLFLSPDSSEASVAIGLLNLGLLVRSTARGLLSDNGAHVMSPLVPSLLALLAE